MQENLQRNLDGDYLVAVNLSPSDRLVLVLLAIWKAGAAYLPLDQAFPGARIEHIVREAKPALVVFDEGKEKKFILLFTTFSNTFCIEIYHKMSPNECCYYR